MRTVHKTMAYDRMTISRLVSYFPTKVIYEPIRDKQAKVGGSVTKMEIHNIHP